MMPEDGVDPENYVPYAGQCSFLIYSTLVMFDMTLTVFVWHRSSVSRTAELYQFYAFLMGLFIGWASLPKVPLLICMLFFPCFWACSGT